MPAIYDELKRLAGRMMARERSDHTLQATALANEAYLRMVGDANLSVVDRHHFYSIMARVMRRVLVDHARAKQAEKRGGDLKPVTLDDQLGVAANGRPVDLLEMDQALDRLRAINERALRVVELRYFTGLSLEETADAVGASLATVKRDWQFAKAWLFRELGPQ